MASLTPNSPLQYVKGVGPRKAEGLARLGLVTVMDMLMRFPRAYLDRTTVTSIAKLTVGEETTIIGTVKAHGMLRGRRRRYELILEDQTAAVTLVFFRGLRWLEKSFKKGDLLAATGTVGFYNGFQLVHPELERLDSEQDQMIHAGRIVPVYPQTAELSKLGLTSRQQRRISAFVLESLADPLPDYLASDYVPSLQLMSRDRAIRQIHYPDTKADHEAARRRLAFDELLALQYFVMKNRGEKRGRTKPHSYQPPADHIATFLDALPFSPTTAQQRTWAEIVADLNKPQPMTRLLHGEVGSGKTLVAILAALYAAENGLQAALMAPTEILAAQHFRNWSEALTAAGARVAWISGSLKPKTRKEIAFAVANGDVDILIGTHALIYDSVEFFKLGLVIIDEQHRFGVEQRGKLHAKGNDPDLLVMTATPIPRTLALTAYGDLDLSTIDELPPGRAPIRTVWRTSDARAKVMSYVREEMAAGDRGQAYIIYPAIEKSEDLPLQSVEEAYIELSRGAFRDLNTAFVHGKVDPEERDATLRQFRDGEIDVLLATTVVEVGIDNPNATILVIEHAERFGLAQLHQLRGRVGRGGKPGLVIALAYGDLSEVARQRLTYFADHTNGFEIAEADLELRGPGELFGRRQSGAPALTMANLARDRDLLEAARNVAGRVMTADGLPANNLDAAGQAVLSYLQENVAHHELSLGGG